jgi:mono/diheme cytochrome c family protein
LTGVGTATQTGLVKNAMRAMFPVAVLLFAVGCRPAPKLTDQQADGKHLYDVGCAHCHEENDLHLKKVPPSLHGLFVHSTLLDGEPATDANVQRILMAGKGTMPSFAYQMSREQMDAVIAYLHSGLRDQKRQ